MDKLGKKKAARKQINSVESVDLTADGLLNSELAAVMHLPPSEIHRMSAAEALGLMSVDQLPHMATVAELMAWVLSVKAASGDDKATNALLDRFSPKAAREASTTVNVNAGDSAPAVASESAEEAKAARDYMSLLKH